MTTTKAIPITSLTIGVNSADGGLDTPILDACIQKWRESTEQLAAEIETTATPKNTPTDTPTPTISDLKALKRKAEFHAASTTRPQTPNPPNTVSEIQQTIVLGLLSDIEKLANANTQIRKITTLLALNWAAALWLTLQLLWLR